MAEGALDLDDKVDDKNVDDKSVDDAKVDDSKVIDNGGQADDKQVDDKTDDKPAFPDTWRELMSGEDEKLQKMAARFQSPTAVLKALADTRAKLSSGDYKQVLPQEPTDEELAAWRKENDVPETSEGYKIELPDDAFVELDDDPLVKGVLDKAHEANIPNGAANFFLNQYNAIIEEQAAQQAAQDLQQQSDGVEALREEWGPEYKANRNAAVSVFGEMADAVLGARAPDGTLLGNKPEFVKWATGIALEVNPAVTLVDGVGNNPEAVADELKKLEAMMGNKHSEYWKGPKAEANQARYIKLLEAKERLT